MKTMKTEIVPNREREKLKLALVNDYNKFMGDVDQNDALVGNYSYVRKTFKWTVKFVMHLIEEAVLHVCFVW